MSNSLPARPILLWAVRLLSFGAMVVCLVLFSMKVSGKITSLAGCGGEGGCGQVMGGEWSEWFHVPVTVLAAGIYMGIIFLTLPSVQRALGKTGDQLLAAAGVILAGAAVYFVSLLLLKEKVNCPWCLGLHLTGLTVAALLLTIAVKVQRAGERGVLEAAMLTGFMAIGLLAAGQVWGPKPETHVMTAGRLSDSLPSTGAAGAAAPVPAGPRVIRFTEGAINLSFEVAKLPLLGAPEAPVVLVEYFDYTCGSCRELAGDLSALKKKWPGTFAVIALPAPLNRACNPFLKQNVPDHPGACELARLSLTFWRAKPPAFGAFHEFLMGLPLPIAPAQLELARRKADEMAGAGAMQAASGDSWVEAQLQENIATLARLTTQKNVMPKLLLRTHAMHGMTKDTATFIRLVEQEYDLSGSGLPVLSKPR